MGEAGEALYFEFTDLERVEFQYVEYEWIVDPLTEVCLPLPGASSVCTGRSKTELANLAQPFYRCSETGNVLPKDLLDLECEAFRLWDLYGWQICIHARGPTRPAEPPSWAESEGFLADELTQVLDSSEAEPLLDALGPLLEGNQPSPILDQVGSNAWWQVVLGDGDSPFFTVFPDAPIRLGSQESQCRFICIPCCLSAVWNSAQAEEGILSGYREFEHILSERPDSDRSVYLLRTELSAAQRRHAVARLGGERNQHYCAYGFFFPEGVLRVVSRFGIWLVP